MQTWYSKPSKANCPNSFLLPFVLQHEYYIPMFYPGKHFQILITVDQNLLKIKLNCLTIILSRDCIMRLKNCQYPRRPPTRFFQANYVIQFSQIFNRKKNHFNNAFVLRNCHIFFTRVIRSSPFTPITICFFSVDIYTCIMIRISVKLSKSRYGCMYEESVDCQLNQVPFLCL